jgi:CRP/FNR family transcriptional regulator, cyclic AMP receptor protein
MDERAIVVSDRVLALLRRMPAFRDVAVPDIQELFSGEGLLRFREYRAGETIIREGDSDSWVYHLVSGQVRVLTQEAEVASLSGYGEVFGEMGPLRGRPRNASVVAATDVACFAVDLSLLDRLPDEVRQRKNRIMEELLSDVVYQRLTRANCDAAALRRDLAMAGSALAGLTDRVRDLERRVADLSRENQLLRCSLGTRDPGSEAPGSGRTEP